MNYNLKVGDELEWIGTYGILIPGDICTITRIELLNDRNITYLDVIVKNRAIEAELYHGTHSNGILYEHWRFHRRKNTKSNFDLFCEKTK